LSVQRSLTRAIRRWRSLTAPSGAGVRARESPGGGVSSSKELSHHEEQA
jgi:hypothetical protein